MTARWAVEVAPQRNLDIRWKPISLLLKNEPEPGSDYHDPVMKTHRMLRVMESVRAAEGEAPMKDLYFALGTAVHHDKQLDFDIGDLLSGLGLDPGHAAAADDVGFDAAIEASMDDGLGLTGDDVGTPIIAVKRSDGERVAYFGPVITARPEGDKALLLWDSLMAMMDIDGFWELKRTRTEGPQFGDRP